MIEAQKEQTFSLGITVTVALKKTSSNVYFIGAKVRALYRFKSQGYTSIVLYSTLYSVFIRFSIKQIISWCFSEISQFLSIKIQYFGYKIRVFFFV